MKDHLMSFQQNVQIHPPGRCDTLLGYVRAPRSIITDARSAMGSLEQEIRRFLDSGNIYEPLVISAGNNFEGLRFLRPNAPDSNERILSRAWLLSRQRF